jgi:hypothetical protein
VVSQPAQTTTPAPAPADLFDEARPVAVRYVRALALGRPAVARRLEAPPDPGAERSLSKLGRWFASVPVARIDVEADPVPLPSDYPSGAIGVRLDLHARLSPDAPTAPAPLGRRVLVMKRAAGAWRVSSDATRDARLGVLAQGLSLFARPRFLTGKHATVAYGAPAVEAAARDVLRAADTAAPRLASTYGGGTAARNPLIFLVRDLEQGERLAGIRIGQEAPLGTVSNGFVYVFLERFDPIDEIGRSSSVVGLMTMLATRTTLEHSPTSLSYGVATYEEDRYLAGRGFILPLDDIGRAYPRYPSIERWTTSAPLWGLSGRAHRLANQDALAMVHVIIERHGGVAAVRRLGEGFGSASAGGFTERQVREVFRNALHVSFDKVRRQAQAYVASGDWKYH